MPDRDARGRYLPGHRIPGPGGPTKYTEERATAVLDAMAAGESSAAACRRLGLAENAAAMWRARDTGNFRRRYIEAFAARAVGFAEEIVDLLEHPPEKLDMPTVTLLRAKVDVRRWLLGRLIPQFADQVQHNVTGEASIVINLPSKDADPVTIEGVATRVLGGEGAGSATRVPERLEGDREGEDSGAS